MVKLDRYIVVLTSPTQTPQVFSMCSLAPRRNKLKNGTKRGEKNTQKLLKRGTKLENKTDGKNKVPNKKEGEKITGACYRRFARSAHGRRLNRAFFLFFVQVHKRRNCIVGFCTRQLPGPFNFCRIGFCLQIFEPPNSSLPLPALFV